MSKQFYKGTIRDACVYHTCHLHAVHAFGVMIKKEAVNIVLAMVVKKTIKYKT